jgi:hypothetical protein
MSQENALKYRIIIFLVGVALTSLLFAIVKAHTDSGLLLGSIVGMAVLMTIFIMVFAVKAGNSAEAIKPDADKKDDTKEKETKPENPKKKTTKPSGVSIGWNAAGAFIVIGLIALAVWLIYDNWGWVKAHTVDFFGGESAEAALREPITDNSIAIKPIFDDIVKPGEIRKIKSPNGAPMFLTIDADDTVWGKFFLHNNPDAKLVELKPKHVYWARDRRTGNPQIEGKPFLIKVKRKMRVTVWNAPDQFK